MLSRTDGPQISAPPSAYLGASLIPAPRSAGCRAGFGGERAHFVILKHVPVAQLGVFKTDGQGDKNIRKMVRISTKVKIIDNSGGLWGRCIAVLTPKNKSQKKRYAKIGDLILISLIKVMPGSKYKKGDTIRAVVVRTNKTSPVGQSPINLSTDLEGSRGLREYQKLVIQQTTKKGTARQESVSTPLTQDDF